MPLFTARSEFVEATQEKDGFNCNGCLEPIALGTRIFTKPYKNKHGKPSAVRLHNLESCWEDFDQRVWEHKAEQREKGMHPRRRKVYAE